MRPCTGITTRFHWGVMIAPQRGSVEDAVNDGSAAPACDGPDPCTPTRREDDDDSAGPHPIKEIDDILVGHADAAG
jgi:hypothetical protein